MYLSMNWAQVQEECSNAAIFFAAQRFIFVLTVVKAQAPSLPVGQQAAEELGFQELVPQTSSLYGLPQLRMKGTCHCAMS